MTIEITGSLCVSCYKYMQYYSQGSDGKFAAIDKGYCWGQHRTTRPGNRCKRYKEKSNVKIFKSEVEETK